MTMLTTPGPTTTTGRLVDKDAAWWEQLVGQLTRRQFFLAGGVVAVTVAAGCSSRETGGVPTTPTTLTITDSRGAQQIPVEVNRVVCLDGGGDLELAALCGYDVVGLYDRSTATVPYPPSLQAAIPGDVTRLPFEPNLEAVAALAPDLILLDSSYWADELGESLTAIAPVLVAARSTDPSPADWRADFTYFADALGHAEAARAALATYDAKIEQLRTGKAGVIAATTLNLFQLSTDGTGGGSLPGPSSTLFGTIVQAVGGSFAPPQNSLTERLELSAETIDTLTGDVIVRTTYDPTPATLAPVDDNPLWPRLPAVAAGRVIDAAVLVTHFGGPALAGACVDLVARAYALNE